MSLLPVGFGASGDDYEITDSLRFRQSASAYLSRTPASAGNQSTWTFSCWWKFGRLDLTFPRLLSTGSSATNRSELIFVTSTNQIRYYSNIGGTVSGLVDTAAVFRDPSAWYHIVVKFDTTESVAADRLKIYVNGVNQTLTTTTAVASGNHYINNARLTTIGKYFDGTTNYIDGYITEVNFIDGQALTADDFGEYDANGTWKAKDYTGTYGTNGFYLPMKPTTQAELQNTVLYAGNTNEQSIDGVGYAPDFVWIKNRTGANNHYLYDTVRGTDRALQSQSTSAEAVGAQQLTSFDTDGFTVPYDVSGYNNYAGRSYVAWTWDAGDNQTSTGISSVQYFGQGVAHSVKGFGFSPDFVWIKSRDIAASHILIDSVRGPGFELSSNSIGAETSNGVTRFKSIDSDGFTLANTTAVSINQQNRNYVAWGWDAGDGDPVSNTTGDIPSTVKASDATGFSIVSYTGTGANGTVGHGLGVAPSFLIVRARDNGGATNWAVWHSSFSSTEYMLLNSTAAKSSAGGAALWNSTVPSSTVFSIGTDTNTNYNTKSIIAYCFSEVSGVSKFDSYIGNGSTTGPVITTGFRPGFVIIKKTNGTDGWYMFDSTRSPFNPIADALLANDSIAEFSNADRIEFTDTGFQLKTSLGPNESSGNYIYMAFKGSYSDHVSPLNETGSTDSRVKANPDKGFSIVTHTGNGSLATIGHGLGVAPSMFISKSRSTANWHVYHASLGNTKAVFLNTTDAAITSINYFNNTSPTSTVFTLNGAINLSGNNYVTYCFAEVAGYSKIDSYTGTGVAGLSVTTGFRPAFVMTKRSDSTSNWNISDSTRSPTGTVNTTALRPNTTDTENTVGTVYVKFTDTGFEITGTSTETNANGGTYIYMAFAETADAVFNFDASGNKNNWLPNNINSNADSESTYDLMKDTPSLVDENAANFATLNPLRQVGGATITDGNLTLSGSDDYTFGTIALPSSGKFYYEMTCGAVGNTVAVGVADSDAVITAGDLSADIRVYASNGNKYTTTGGSAYGSTYTTGDVIGVACDMTNNTILFYKNNVSQGNAFTDLADTTRWIPYLGSFNATGGGSINFGQRPFAYTPPTGFLKLNTFNLPDSTIEDGSQYFAATTYAGAGDPTTVAGLEFQPDFLWAKNRTNANAHWLQDSVRGGRYYMFSSSTSAEGSLGAVDATTFNNDGFTGNINSAFFTNASYNYVAWNWKANGSGVSNTVGTIPSTVSANTTSGFSIVSYTGVGGTGTVGHGLGATPKFIITKTRSIVNAWHNYHASVGAGYRIFFSSAVPAASSTVWNNTSPTSTVFSVGDANTNGSGTTMIAYCFAEVPGYSAFGSYTGNGSTDGPFVYLGFRPRYLMIKRTDVGDSWAIKDTARDTYNVDDSVLKADLADAEGTSTFWQIDILSNGFKLRNLGSTFNNSGGNYIYMAFAENPFKNANAR
jgi:hypothetical protein